MMKRTANVKVKTLPTSQKALDLWMIILKIVKDARVPVKFSWVKFGEFAMEYAAPDRSKGWATIVKMSKTDSDIYLFRPRGLSPGKKYRVTFDNMNTKVKISGLELIREGLPIRLEAEMSSELLLFEAQ